MRVERVGLEDHRQVAVLGVHFVADALVDDELAGGDLLEPGDAAKQRRFSAARRADEHQELAGGDGEVDALEHFGVAVGLDEVL
jgi:hypothetical protein